MTKKLQYIGITKRLYDNYESFLKDENGDKQFVRNIYTYTAEQLYFRRGYEEKEIEHFFNNIYDKINPDYYQDETYYTKFKTIDKYVQHLFDNMDADVETTIQENPIMNDITEYLEHITKLLEETTKEPNKQVEKIIKEKSLKQQITEQLQIIKKGVPRGETEKVITKLVELLEQEEHLFTVDFPDPKQPDGYKGYYYYINPKTNSYEKNSKNHLKTLFEEKYGVKLHKNKNFYYNILDRVYNNTTEQTHLIEMENVFIDRRNYNIIEKNNDKIMFTTDRLIYNTYDTHELKLFHYDKNATLDNILNGQIEMSFPMKRVFEIFVPKLQPEQTDNLRMFLQYMGLMIIGRNPAKLLIILYDLEDERMGNKGRTTLFEILKICFSQTFVRVGKEVFADKFKINTYAHGKHGIYMDEMDKDILVKNHTVLKEVINGSGTSGASIQTREQINIDSLPFLIGSNGLPDPPLFDTALLNRILLIELPNQFVDESKVNENTNTYPKINNLDDMILQNIEGLGQLISVALNEFKQLDLSKSLDGQFAIRPDIDKTIQVLTQNNIVLGLLNTYTKPIARGPDIKKDWVTASEIQTTIAKAYHRATQREMDTNEVDLAKIGLLLKQLYPSFLGDGKQNKIRRDKTRYNLTLYTYDEVQQIQNQILEVEPLGENQRILDPFHETIYKLIQNGVNTEQKIQNEIPTEHTFNEINEALEELYEMGLIRWTNIQSL